VGRVSNLLAVARIYFATDQGVIGPTQLDLQIKHHARSGNRARVAG
jgi:hypothetical protein